MKILKDAFTVATRIYHDASTGLISTDRLVRTASNKFYLVEEPSEPEGRHVVRPLSLVDVFDWYQLEPWQISRTVIANGGRYVG